MQRCSYKLWYKKCKKYTNKTKNSENTYISHVRILESRPKATSREMFDCFVYGLCFHYCHRQPIFVWLYWTTNPAWTNKQWTLISSKVLFCKWSSLLVRSKFTVYSIVIFCYISDDASDSIEVQQKGIGSLKNKNDQRNGGRINITLTDNPHDSKWLHMYYSLKIFVHGLLCVIW